jgi:hypothetical protein
MPIADWNCENGSPWAKSQFQAAGGMHPPSLFSTFVLAHAEKMVGSWPDDRRRRQSGAWGSLPGEGISG